MATYFPNSSSPRNVMPTMYLRDVNQASFSEAMVPGSTVYMNYPNDGSFTENIANHSQPQQHSVDLPLAGGILAQDSSSEVSRASTSLHGLLSNMVGSRVGETLDAWRGGRNEMVLLQPRGPIPNMQVTNAQMSAEGDLVHNAVTENSDANLRTQLGILHGGQGLQFHRSSMSMVPGQGLSLTLGTQIPSAVPISAFQFRHGEQNISFVNPHHAAIQDDHNKDDSLASKQSGNDKYPPGFTGAEPIVKGDVLGNVHCQPMMKHLHMNPSPYSAPNLSTAISNSKYLKATQELLDEVVNVRKALKPEEEMNPNFKMSIGINGGGKELESGSKASGNQSSGGVAEDANPNPPVELSPTERQELQMKLTQLLAMLDEVDRRYKQYYHQMQIVVSSFDAIAGYGAAKTYTALALQTISKHFRCLRDAISGQIQATRKSLGEQDPTSGKSGGLSRLRFVDQQLRQQRALQQLGMLQPHAWRPQRGLPESSVTILRAWLFEHFLHPYPKDSDKLMLARQTGLSRSQVSNWFINARVRLWKPMIEEMYKEETVDVDLDSISSSDNNAPPKDGDTTRGSQDKELQGTSKAPETSQASESNASKPETSYADMGGTPGLQTGPLVNEDGSNHRNMVFWDQRTNAGSNLLQDAIVHSDSSGRFISYHMPGMGRFGPPEAYPGSGQSNNNNNVSLTLGLQHCDSGGLSASREQQNYITVRDEEMYNTTPPVGASTSNYECLDVGNRRHSRFGSSQMLHDFVA